MSRRRRRAANPKETLEKVWSLPETEREAALDRRAKAAAEAFAAGAWPKEEFADGFFDWSHPGASAFAGKLFEAGWDGKARGRPMFAVAAEADRRGSSSPAVARGAMPSRLDAKGSTSARTALPDKSPLAAYLPPEGSPWALSAEEAWSTAASAGSIGLLRTVGLRPDYAGRAGEAQAQALSECFVRVGGTDWKKREMLEILSAQGVGEGALLDAFVSAKGCEALRSELERDAIEKASGPASASSPSRRLRV